MLGKKKKKKKKREKKQILVFDLWEMSLKLRRKG